MSLVYQHILSRWVLGSDWPPKNEQLRSPDLDQQQSGPLPATFSGQITASCLRGNSEQEEALPRQWAESPPARPIERHGALSRHITCSNKQHKLLWPPPTVLTAATMEVYSSLGGWGDGGNGGEMLKTSSWQSDIWGRVHWRNCSYNLTGWWPVFHQSFLSSHCQRSGTQVTFRKMGPKATALQLTFFLKVLHIYNKIRDFYL